MSAKDRRALYHKFDKNYDPLLSLNVDDYLIETHPHLNATQRKAVWVTCQRNDSFDWVAVKDQIDKCVKTLYDDKNS